MLANQKNHEDEHLHCCSLKNKNRSRATVTSCIKKWQNFQDVIKNKNKRVERNKKCVKL